MNNKFYIGLSLLILLLILGIFLGFWVEKRQEPVKSDLISAQDAVKNEDLQEGRYLLSQAQSKWQRNWKGIASFSHHATMEEIDRVFAQLTVCDDEREFLLRSAELCSLLDALTNDHIFSWWNLL